MSNVQSTILRNYQIVELTIQTVAAIIARKVDQEQRNVEALRRKLKNTKKDVAEYETLKKQLWKAAHAETDAE